MDPALARSAHARRAFGAVLLLRGLQLREDFTVSTDFLALELLGVRDVGKKLADVVQLAAESVDIITQIRRVIIMSLILDGLDDIADLADSPVEVLELSVDLALYDFQIRDDDANPHHYEGGDRRDEIRTEKVCNR